MNHNSDRSSFTVGVPASAAITRVILRSVAASVLIAVALTAGAYLFWLVLRGQLGLVHVRWLSRAAFAFLMIAPAMLLAANRSYSAQRRGYGFAFLVMAVTFLLIAVSCALPIVLLVLRDSGILIIG